MLKEWRSALVLISIFTRMAVMCSYSGDKMSLALGLVPRLMFYGFDFFFFFFKFCLSCMWRWVSDAFQSLFLPLVLYSVSPVLSHGHPSASMHGWVFVISSFYSLLCFVFVLTFLVAFLLIILTMCTTLSLISCPRFLLSSHKAL